MAELSSWAQKGHKRQGFRRQTPSPLAASARTPGSCSSAGPRKLDGLSIKEDFWMIWGDGRVKRWGPIAAVMASYAVDSSWGGTRFGLLRDHYPPDPTFPAPQPPVLRPPEIPSAQ
jgi:hypothetical protein